MLAVKPPKQPQPLCLAVADNDVAFAKQGFDLLESWRDAGGSVELHWYEGGGHGFGSAPQGTTSDHWFDQFSSWLKARKLVK
jgi:acetyl esterase/lipase